jgi:hypothetical protein
MTTQTTALRNRVYRDPAADRMAFAETSDATHRDGERYVWRDDDGIPASGRQTAAIVGTCAAFTLLLIGVLVIVYAQRHGGFSWQR